MKRWILAIAGDRIKPVPKEPIELPPIEVTKE
jgi:hypothetical protein